MVLYMGGKCQKCGYSKCYDALEFHHLDPKKKDFQLSALKNYSLNALKKELDKCIMLCANCHREEHARLRKVRPEGIGPSFRD